MLKRVWRNITAASNNKANLFVIKILLVYLCWKIFHAIANSPHTPLNPYWLAFVKSAGTFYAQITSVVLNIIGQETFTEGITIVFAKSRNRIRVEDHCLAIPAMVVFTGSIALFVGKTLNKLWFILLGLFGVFLINLMRLVFVSLTFEHLPHKFYEINHSFIYVVITYSLIFGMIVWWMKRFDQTGDSAKS